MDWIDKIGGTDGSLLGTLALRFAEITRPFALLRARLTRKIRGLKTFEYDGRQLEYLVAPYNTTWRNERSVELAIAFDWLDRRPAGPILEVGHVLGHYRPNGPDHTVVDLYEPEAGVLNVDALDYNPEKRFTSIVAVSTLEHVGFDEDDQDPEKTRRLLDHLVTLLAPGGELLVTFPVGYNRYLDDHMTAGDLKLEPLTLLKRHTNAGMWSEVPLSEAPRQRYGLPFQNGNAIAVGRRSA